MNTKQPEISIHYRIASCGDGCCHYDCHDIYVNDIFITTLTDTYLEKDEIELLVERCYAARQNGALYFKNIDYEFPLTDNGINIFSLEEWEKLDCTIQVHVLNSILEKLVLIDFN